MTGTTCQAILVNYHGAEQICDAAASLVDDPACNEIHIVDNSVCLDQATWLRRHLHPSIKLTVTPENLGFAGACNLAFANSNADFVLLLNPDARLMQGALHQLKKTLSENPGAAAVGPRVFWDSEHQFLLPPSTYPSRMDRLLECLSKVRPTLATWRADRFRRRAIGEWQQTSVFRVDALSGGHVLLRRSALQQAGGLFDPRFFMYWEDSDLMRRLHDAGQYLLLDPCARAVHLYEHSPAKDRLISEGWTPYRQKHYSTAFWRWLDRMTDRFAAGPHSLDDTQEAIAPKRLSTETDIEILVPTELQAGWLLEFSPSSSFVPSIGRLGHGAIARLPGTLASRFTGREYHLRLGSASLDNGRSQTQTFLVGAGPTEPERT